MDAQRLHHALLKLAFALAFATLALLAATASIVFIQWFLPHFIHFAVKCGQLWEALL